jgi:hypothetical protein
MLNLQMLDDSSVLSEIYSSDQRGRAIDVLSVGSTSLEKRSLWNKAGGAGNKTVLVEYDEYRAKQMRDGRSALNAEARVGGLMNLLVLYYI